MNASAGKRKPSTIKHLHEPICNPEGEQAILGAILLRPQVLNQISDILEPGDFYRTAHARIYQAMVDLYKKGDPVDLVSVNTLLKERGQLEEVGGPVFLVSLSEQVGFATNADYYARLVHDKAVLRRLEEAAKEIALACHGPVEKVEEFVDAAEQRIFSIGQTRRPGIALPLKDLLPPEIQLIESLYYHPGTPGLSTGFTDLDRVTGGFQAGDLIILAARPSMGKTALGLNIAYNGATQAQTPVVIFSLEMSRRQLMNRLIAMAGNLDSYRLKQGLLTPEEWRMFEKVSADLQELPIFINDETMITPMQVRSEARRLRAEHGIGSGNRRLPATDERPGVFQQKSRTGSRQYFQKLEGPRQGAFRSR